METRFKLSECEVRELLHFALRSMIENNWAPESMVGRCEDIIEALCNGGLVLTEEDEEKEEENYKKSLGL